MRPARILLRMPRKIQSLDAFLVHKHITQNALARELGISAIFLSEIRRGKRTPSLRLALRIAEHCNIPVESLLPAEHGESGTPA